MRQLQLGVIGCGVIGLQHIKSAAELHNVNLVSVADLREELAEETAEKYGAQRVSASADELIDSHDVEAVVLALPAGVRGEIAIRALEAGKHVLLEKPAAMNGTELEGIAVAAAKSGKTVACASMRFSGYEYAKAARDFVASGALGDLRIVRVRAVRPAGASPKNPPPVWRLRRDLNAGGILVNWGVYDLDFILGIIGWKLRPQTVLAQTWPVGAPYAAYAAPGSDAETHVAAQVRCAGNIALLFERSEFTPTVADEAWSILGEKGTLRLKLEPSGQRELLHDAHDLEKGVVTQVVWAGQEDFHGKIHQAPLRDFAEAIIQHRPPLTGLEQIRLMQQIIDAIYQSADSGKAVEIG